MHKRNFERLLLTTLVVVTGFIPLFGINANTLYAQENEAKVSLVNEGNNTFTFGNKFLTRTFAIEDGRLVTKKLTNGKTDKEQVLIPQNGSEEFIITTLENSVGNNGFKEPADKISFNNWKAEADSVETSREGDNGKPEKIFDGDASTYYHSQYNEPNNKESYEWPHNIYINFGEKLEGLNSLAYHKRLHEGSPTQGGHINEYEVYACESEEELKDSTKGKLVASGNFKSNLNTKVEYVNFNETINTQYLRFVVKSSYSQSEHKYVTSIGELEFYKDKAQFPEKEKETIKTSELTVNGEPNVNVTNDNGVNLTTLTFSFDPVVVRGVEYTINEVITMKDGESFMRKHLEISVPEADAAKAKINYIDLENMNFASEDTIGSGNKNDGEKTNYWTIPEQSNNGWMANMNGDYLELGQPYYVGAMYWGCEFPQTENKIRGEEGKKNGYIRYHYGKNLSLTNEHSDGQFNLYNNYNGADGKNGKMVTWDAVVGAARSTDYQVVQADFYEYIETIATKTDFRQQYNSWYDNMKEITNENILESFAQIEKGFTQNGVEPLDSYVVDDGWVDYSSFWGFNGKFPNQLYDSKLQVEQMGSNFGLWLGPRGGYGTQTQIANAIANMGLGSVNTNSENDINISDARYLNKLTEDIFVKYQNNFDINYWKLDGMLLNPSTNNTNHHVTGNAFYTISETYERWTDMFEKMRSARGGKDLWINLTSFVNPSPWFLQWVNSVWMQNTGDGGFYYAFDATDQQAQLTYRDTSYYEFFNDRQWQLPNKYFYNHDPIYGKTANNAPGGKANYLINHTVDEFREHLYMMGTRGTAFWEYYYSPSMLDADPDKWQVNAEAADWIESNFHILQKSKMFGDKPYVGTMEHPKDAGVYGYSCWNGDEGIISIRNPHNTTKEYTLKLDRLIGVGENVKNLHGKVIIGDVDKYQTNGTVSYNDTITYTLKPKEVLIMQYGKQDTKSADIDSIHANGNTVEVEFNETIRPVDKTNFKVEGYIVNDANLNADRRTVTLTLDKEIVDLSTIKVSVNNVKDTVGNTTNAETIDDYYKDDIITGIVDRNTDGNVINKGDKYAVDGHKDFSIVAKLNTESSNATIAKQEGVFEFKINEEGYLSFTFNDMNITSRFDKTVLNNGQTVTTTEGKINDGKDHIVAAVKEVNGMIKIYIDGKVVASTYDENKVNPEVNKSNVSFADGLIANVKCITLLDTALAFDEISSFIDVTKNVALSRINKDAKVSAFNNDENKTPAKLNNQMPLSNANNGNKATNQYAELGDTTSGKHESRFYEIDLGKNYDLNKLVLTRYFDDKRIYDATVVALYDENDTDFSKPTIIYNSDEKNVHGLGAGQDEKYQETANGKTFDLEKAISSRYIRIYVYGNLSNSASTSDHLVEIEAYANIKGTDLPIRIDYSELEALINEDLNIKYTKDSIKAYNNDKEVKELIKEAKNILSSKNETTTNNITRVIEGLRAKQKQLLVFRANLDEAIALQNKLNSLELNSKDYTKDTWKDFISNKNALDAAIKDNSNIDDATIKDIIKKVEESFDALIVDASDLEKLYNKHVDKKQANFTSESFAKFEKALKQAKAVLENKDRTKKDVDDAYKALEDAIKSLKPTKPMVPDTAVHKATYLGGAILLLVSIPLVTIAIRKFKKQ